MTSSPASDRSRQHRRWVLHLVISLVVALAVAEVAVRVIEPWLPAPDRWYVLAAEEHDVQLADHAAAGDCFDIVAIGSSRTRFSFDPTVVTETDPLARTAYNAALPLGRPRMLEHWLDAVVLPRARPTMVTIGLDQQTFVDAGLRGADEMLARYHSHLAAKLGPTAGLERWLAERTALVRHRRYIANPSDLFRSLRAMVRNEGPPAGRDVDDLDRVFPLGQPPPSPEAWTAEDRSDFLAIPDEPSPISEAEMAGLRRIVTRLQDEGIEVALVLTPNPPTLYEYEPWADNDRRMTAVIERFADEFGVPIVDLRTGWDDEDFYDIAHQVNDAAAEASRQLAKRLPPSPRCDD